MMLRDARQLTCKAARKSRTGFSLMIVMAAIMIMAGGVAAISILFATDAKRTRAALAGPELRQLLAAGEAAARDELAARGTAARDVTVTTPVDAAGLKVHIAPSDGGAANSAADVRVIAEFRSMRAAQLVQFVRQGDGPWTVKAVRLEQMPIQ